tara:strand:+ start:170 stop:460 length:291 start_codon:yes stop_codon:yes gene_type:complete
MSKKKNKNPLLSEEQQKQLQDMVNGMLDVAANVMEEYEGDMEDIELDDLRSLSGSLTQIHEDSPFLDELLKGDSWKRVIKNIPITPKNSKEDDDTK